MKNKWLIGDVSYKFQAAIKKKKDSIKPEFETSAKHLNYGLWFGVSESRGEKPRFDQ